MRPGLTDIIVLLDRSGSMQVAKSDTIGGFNNFIEEQAKLPGEARVTFVQFDSHDPHEVAYSRRLIAEVPQLTDSTYQPRGSTPLYDAMGKTIHAAGEVFAAMAEDDKPETVVMVILTDGQENCSHEWTRDGVFKLVQEQQEKWGWKFVYLGANQDAMAVSAQIGVKFDAAAQNVSAYASSSHIGTRGFSDGSRVTAHYRTK